jgi:hypothetical protein
MTMIIAGIGARVTPMPVLMTIEQVGMMLAMRGIGGRSGGADGADTAFQRGYTVINPALLKVYQPKIGHYIEWQDHASRFHPNWGACDEHARKLHARNSAVMLGDSPMSAPVPVNAVVCWTEGGAITGGTGQSLRIAQHYSIPVFNLAITTADAFWSWLDGK